MLAAGFIGQFGKRLADYLVSRGRDRRARTSSAPPRETAQGNGPDQVSSEPKDTSDVTATAAAKIAKKADKSEVKRRKKTPL